MAPMSNITASTMPRLSVDGITTWMRYQPTPFTRSSPMRSHGWLKDTSSHEPSSKA